ncbi:MAG TPA: 50S ribosomal protein L24 [Candidatus Saccharimonadales bacterium]|jgi:large subunit ribosomal protein L24|nr:50S ribosomal protein L24 [Candidatus Saccharimonadales bacterium]
MAANRVNITMKIKKNDTVKVIAGAHKGQLGKVLAVHPATHSVTVDGLGKVKRHIKPNQVNPRGGTKDVHVPIDISKVALVVDEKAATTSRVAYEIKSDGSKVRVARQLKNKEIK